MTSTFKKPTLAVLSLCLALLLVAATAPVCGDQRIDTGEQCDNGASSPDGSDGCWDNCTVHPAFTCTRSRHVPSACNPICGDGVLVGYQLFPGFCDDGNTLAGDGCSPFCLVEKQFLCAGTPSVCNNTCGNGKVEFETQEKCDNGDPTGAGGCFSNCTVMAGFRCSRSQGVRSNCTPICGDGLRVGAELSSQGCDDGNTKNRGGCSRQCMV